MPHFSSLPHSSLFGKPFKSTRALLSTLGLIVASSVAVHAQLIDVANQGATDDAYTNTGNMSGAAVLASSTNSTATPDQWNILTSNSQTIDLADTSGVGTGATLTTNFEGSNFSGQDSVGGFEAPLFEHFLYTFTGSSASLDFAGLAHSTTYELVLYNLNDNGGSDTTYTVNGVQSTLIENGHNGFYSQPTVNAVDPGTVYTGNYIELTGTSSSTGGLDITLGVAPTNRSNNAPGDAPADNSYLAFTGLQLEPAAVPEPSTLALMAAGVAGLAFLVRRNRHSFGQRI